MKNRIYFTVFIFLTLLTGDLKAHVGSPGVVFEGKAGPYQLIVNVNPPDVIPGTAQVQIYVENGLVDNITVKPIYWYAGDEGSPSADPALPVEGSPGQFSGVVWLMRSGAASLEINVEGVEGSGVVRVPINAVSTAQKEMEPGLGITLSILGLLLVILMATIIGASVSDGVVAPGTKASFKGRKLKGATITLAILALILYGGANWWNSWAEDYRNYMYKPYQATSSVKEVDGSQVLNFSIDPGYVDYRGELSSPTYLVADHGKIMHMFVMREGSLDAFAHLHPRRRDSLTFQTNWPPLPKGRYFVFADVVLMNGFQETIVDTVDVDIEIPQDSWVRSDSDDTFIRSNPVFSGEDVLMPEDIIVCGKPGIRTPLPDGSTAIWEHDSSEPLQAGQLYPMTYAILNPDGEPAELEPYMGMMGHMVVMKHDGSVYIHLHPVGSYSTASQEIMDQRVSEEGRVRNLPDKLNFMDSVNAEVMRIASLSEADRNSYLETLMDHDWESEEHEGHSTVTFPYVFPEAGKYRIWIQMKRNGQVLNTAFDAEVVE
ncbi:MAG: hypothetical protein P8X57_00945 [Cyclobacteriaceae bacterium]